MANALNLPIPQFYDNKSPSWYPGAMSFASGAFGNSGAPFGAASEGYNSTINRYLPQMQTNMQPYMEAGASAIPHMNESFGRAGEAYGNAGNALNRMSDPQEFMRSIMQGYQESPQAMMEREAGNKGITNAASASGMLGSGALMKSSADYNQRLTAKDMQQYLQNILGINKDYLSGQLGMAGGLNSLGASGYGNLANMGEKGAGSLNALLAEIAQHQAEAEASNRYGEESGDQQDWGNMLGGLFDIGKSFIPGGNFLPSFGGR